MRTWLGSIALTVAVSLLLGGPLAPVVSAQQPAPQADLMQEALKASARADADTIAYDIGAGVANAFVVPGKAILCVTGGVVGFTLMAITFGTAYKASAGFVREGCGGRWTVTGDDLRPGPQRSSAFEWESQLREP
ncbi:MAG: hypothetical protein HYV94_19095 [Candidatus Rokubacteria bacterium]|nr:hypothetical protein [Candidatus Rokubacteria bacterium]